MIDVVYAIVLVAAGWALLAAVAHTLNPPADEDVTASGMFRFGSERTTLWRTAARQAAALTVAAWLFFTPLLFLPAARRAPAVAGLLLACALAASSTVVWRVAHRGYGWIAVFVLAQAVVQLTVLLLVAGLVTSQELDSDAVPRLQTRLVLREVGIAWRQLRMTSEASAPEGPEEPGPMPPPASVSEELVAAAWPRLEPHEVAELLVPRFIESLPTVDGWSRQLEYRGWLQPSAPAGSALMVRSAGEDGAFAASYVAGAEYDDLLWVAGRPSLSSD